MILNPGHTITDENPFNSCASINTELYFSLNLFLWKLILKNNVEINKITLQFSNYVFRHNAVDEDSPNSSKKRFPSSINTDKSVVNFQLKTCSNNILEAEKSSSQNYHIFCETDPKNSANSNHVAAEVKLGCPSKETSFSEFNSPSQESSSVLLDQENCKLHAFNENKISHPYDLSKRVRDNKYRNQPGFLSITPQQVIVFQNESALNSKEASILPEENQKLQVCSNLKPHRENDVYVCSIESLDEDNINLRVTSGPESNDTRIIRASQGSDNISKGASLRVNAMPTEMQFVSLDAKTEDPTGLQNRMGKLLLTNVECENFPVKVCGTSSVSDNHDLELNINDSLNIVNTLCEEESKKEDKKHLTNLYCSTVKPCIGNRTFTYAEVLSRKKMSTPFYAHDRSQAANFSSPDLISKSHTIKNKIEHQCSKPNLNIDELERISEKPREKLLDTKTEDLDSRRIFPRTVKLYQLLATQSEDRSNDEFHLAERRTSFQITEHENKTSTEQKLFHTESVPSLKVSDFSNSGFRNLPQTVRSSSPARKFSSPGQLGGAQKNMSDINSITVRPIYPYCPYSPYGSPQGSPTTRRRPLRESRRISVDNRHGALQLNQYKLLDNIGQVRQITY